MSPTGCADARMRNAPRSPGVRNRPNLRKRLGAAMRSGVQPVEGAAEVERGRHARVREPGGRQRRCRAIRGLGTCSRSCRARAEPTPTGRIAEPGRRPGLRRGSTTRSRSDACRTTKGSVPAVVNVRSPATSAPSLTVDAAAKRVSAWKPRVAPCRELVHPDPGGAVRTAPPAAASRRASVASRTARARNRRARRRAAAPAVPRAAEAGIAVERLGARDLARGRARAGRRAARACRRSPARRRAPPRRDRVRPRTAPATPSGVFA